MHMNDLKIRMNFKQNKYYVSDSVLGTVLYKFKTNLKKNQLDFLCR